jgi:hypothetical protein
MFFNEKTQILQEFLRLYVRLLHGSTRSLDHRASS